jgi:hypothetical protein
MVPLGFELVSLWSRVELDKPTAGEARITVLTPVGKRSVPNVTAIDLREFRRLRSRSQIAGLPLDRPGLYWFVVELRQEEQNKWTEVAKIPLEISIDSLSPGTTTK